MSVVSRITRAPILTSMKLNSTELHFFLSAGLKKKAESRSRTALLCQKIIILLGLAKKCPHLYVIIQIYVPIFVIKGPKAEKNLQNYDEIRDKGVTFLFGKSLGKNKAFGCWESIFLCLEFLKYDKFLKRLNFLTLFVLKCEVPLQEELFGSQMGAGIKSSFFVTL